MTEPTFSDFFVALHPGRRPFDWQRRAAGELARNGWWSALRAPTGAGKTALVDCWLHAVAASGPDLLGRRLAWVVDRRSVVDQVFAYVGEVLAALTDPHAPPAVASVAERLRAVGGGTLPSPVLWRGGLDDEGHIALRDPLDPSAVSVLVSTVDQVGSRLLFRGYGIGRGSRALHAGLLGVDTAIVVDEAHLSRPLRETVAAVAARQRRAPGSPRPPVRLCAISATHDPGDGFDLHDAERRDSAIARRLTASKAARLEPHAPAKRLIALVRELGEEGAKVIGVVLNTVSDAREAFDALASLAPREMEDRVLLIGPVRALDRLDLLAAIPDHDQRAAPDRPFIVVATQTIEVGVDLDFDALVTACAAGDSLIQRFGRLDRAGRHGATRAVVLAPPAKGDPVYGESAAQTWAWLHRGAVDGVVHVGVQELEALVDRLGPPPTAAEARTIRLLDEHVDALAVTDGLDHEGPAVELLLHGEREASADVSVAWRRIADGDAATELELRPLHPGEMVTMSLAALRRWLTTRETQALSDLEGQPDAGAPDSRDHQALARRAAWRLGAEGVVSAIRRAAEVRPTDTVVLAHDSGGLDGFGWAPASREPVDDLGSLAARGPRAVLSAAPLADADLRTFDEVVEALVDGELDGHEAARRLAPLLDQVLPAADPSRPRRGERIARARASLAEGHAVALDDGRILVLGKDDRSAFAAPRRGPVTLDEHQTAVADRVGATTSAVGLSLELSDSLALAARHHDEGKRDPRFQAWLRGGRPAERDLAKATYRATPDRVRRMREAAGWPAGKRHELVSAAALRAAVPDDVLAAWLAATHHGRNRPFAAATADDPDLKVTVAVNGRPVTLAAQATPAPTRQLQEFTELQDALGPWGLAFIEALLTFADRAVSAEEAR